MLPWLSELKMRPFGQKVYRCRSGDEHLGQRAGGTVGSRLPPQADTRLWSEPGVARPRGVWPEMAFLVDGRAVKTVTVSSTKRADYRFDVDLAAGIHEIAAAFLNDAVIGKEDRDLYLERFTISPPPGAAEPVLADKQELAEAAEKREREIVAATQAAIEKHRKADAKIRIVDAAGRPMPGVKVSVEQTAHEFLFGCNIYMFDRLQERGPERRLQEAVRGAVQLRHGRLLLAMVRARSAASRTTSTPTRLSLGAGSTGFA